MCAIAIWITWESLVQLDPAADLNITIGTKVSRGKAVHVLQRRIVSVKAYGFRIRVTGLVAAAGLGFADGGLNEPGKAFFLGGASRHDDAARNRLTVSSRYSPSRQLVTAT